MISDSAAQALSALELSVEGMLRELGLTASLIFYSEPLTWVLYWSAALHHWQTGSDQTELPVE